jgi:hypothetical protein
MYMVNAQQRYETGITPVTQNSSITEYDTQILYFVSNLRFLPYVSRRLPTTSTYHVYLPTMAPSPPSTPRKRQLTRDERITVRALAQAGHTQV